MTSSEGGSVQHSEATDILVVGAGMAGLYCSWRLAQSGRQVGLVEQLDRVGGRLQTDHLEINGEPVEAEEGGMRMMTSQRELQALVKKLNLADQIVSFPMGGKENLFFLRGRRFSVGEAEANPAIWSEIYRLDDGSKNKQPGKILWGIRNQILRENGKDPKTWVSNPENWTDFRLNFKYKGIPLNQWGFWALLDDHGLSQDCIEMLYESSGFIAPYDQQVNAGCAFQLLADFVDPEFFALKNGYGTLPAALETDLRQRGVPIALNHRVRGIERRDDGRLQVSALHGDRAVEIVCNKVVLAVTQIALRQLAYFVPELRENAQFMSDIETVTDMALGKINLFYDRNWWTPKLGVRTGACFTDMPLAQVYFFQEPDRPDDLGPGHITIYTDYYRANFWAELQAMGEPYHSGQFPKNPRYTQPASKRVVEVINRQMREMFNLADIPEPVLSTYKDWIDPRYGDGDHQWRINVDDRIVRKRLTCPTADFHVCGESYSDDQAWVNGALRSADEMLAAHFDLAPLSSSA